MKLYLSQAPPKMTNPPNKESSSKSSPIPISRHLTAFGAKLSKVVSKDADRASLASTLVEDYDPNLRPRAQSSGRGGLGNIRPNFGSASTFADAPPSVPRGRDTAPKKISTGRGGAGNFRESSSSPAAETTPRTDSTSPDTNYSSGRGGLGNISRAREKDQTGSENSKTR
ncbi:hypothetical protein CPB85DRAFT_1273374 [Mucidula mucida]|nr:hypothetical protein CPB85DRAFT_1273374 [Mucidula mucida]